ncbi:hypothetical protein [Mesorhizobium muleiense]|uniref:hypothetical protein n=1 Tax=Mesorhizobium muleiense TaxID=1004279 RepID=UPI001F16B614|nr:hypothetical protein [Mesorhizobium muleiense]MCF6112209.1 hypothetical protein [Mesorhizobium muleiense]
MFDWLTGRRKREELFAAEMMKAAAAGQKLASLRSALSTLGVILPKDHPSPSFVAEAASGLTHTMLRTVGKSISDDDVLFTAGLFVFVAANHFSFQVAEPFEESASLAVAVLVGPSPTEFARAHTAIVDAYNSMSKADSPTLLAIGKTIARWTASPSAENYASLCELFSLCIANVKPT